MKIFLIWKRINLRSLRNILPDTKRDDNFPTCLKSPVSSYISPSNSPNSLKTLAPSASQHPDPCTEVDRSPQRHQITPSIACPRGLSREQRNRSLRPPIIDNISSERWAGVLSKAWMSKQRGGLGKWAFPEISRIRSINKSAGAYPRDLRRNL